MGSSSRSRRRKPHGPSTLRGRRRDLADQLRRASTSIALNIAEGAGEYAPKDKAKFYRFAKRSAAECAAVIEIALKLDPALKCDEDAKQLERLTAMLIRLVRSCES